MINRTKLESAIYTAIVVVCALVFFFCLMALGGCKAPESMIKDRTFDITPKPIQDTLYNSKLDTNLANDSSAIMDTSGSWTAYKITPSGDTTGKAKVYPKAKKIELSYKPEAQKITVHDTIPVYRPKPEIKEVVKPFPLLSKIGLVALGFIAGIVAYIFIKQKH